MKARLLVGLLTVALGGLTSCSNILEENGVINNVAESGMGELRINLSTDASLNVSTKAEAGKENVQNITKYQGTITVTTTKGDNVSGEPTLPSTEGTYKLPLGTYTLSAKNEKDMGEEDFKWNYPVLATTEDKTVTLLETSPIKTAELTLTLQNSIIAVDNEAWKNLKKSINITAFQVVNTTENISDKSAEITNGMSLLNENSTDLYEGLLYAKSTLDNVKVVLDGYVGTDQNQNTFRAVTDIKPNDSTSGTALGLKNKYNIGFNLDTDNGSLTIKVTVNNQVNSETITLPINPYDSTTQENQSSGNGE